MSLRSRILLLVLLATLAPAAALAFYLFAQRDHEVEKSRRSLGAQAAYTAEMLDNKIKGTVQLLHGLSRAPELDTPIRAACSDFLGEVLARYPQYTGLLTINPAGDLHCDSLRTGRTLNLSERTYFKQAKATLQPAYDVVFGGLTGLAVLQVAYPVPDGSGKLKYVLLASLNLSEFARAFVAGSQHQNMMLLFWSRDGTLMVREPDSDALKLAGKRLPDLAVFRFSQSGTSGATAELDGPGGRPAIWALGTLPDPEGGGLRINLGVRRDALVAEANRGLSEALVMLVGASLLALAGALLVAELGIRRHAVRITGVVARVGAGDLGARIGAPYPSGELGKMMAVVDTTVEAVQAQRAELERSGRDLRRANRMLQVLSGINALVIRVREREALFREACRIAVVDGGFRKAWIGLVNRSTMAVEPVVWEGLLPAHLAAIKGRFSLADGAADTMIARAILENRIFCSNDTQSDPAIRWRQEHIESGTRALAILPLASAGEVIGVLVLYSEEAGIFDEAELQLLQELAGDVSFALEHIEKSDRLDYLARYDPLTGLANSELFGDRLTEKVAAAAAAGRKLAVFVVDIERFKNVNDTLGRRAGDELLRQVAERLVRATGDPSRFARVGADRFAAVSMEVQTEEDAIRLADQRLALCAAPFRLDGTEMNISVKAGIAFYPDDGTDAVSLFRNAEIALKTAKATGARLVFYTRKMSQRIAETLSLENKLRDAMEKEQFVLHYQPRVALEGRQIVGVEALIRWQSPEFGLVPPAKFISLLEETGLILPVGAWALKRAARDQRAWAAAGPKAPRVAVNVSAIQLRQRDFVEIVERSIADGKVPAGIDLEITESVLMDDIEGNIAKLKRIQAMGIQVAIDDFGTGYSSLAYLAKLPVQALKIDRTFISSMLNETDTMTLVSTMISLAHSLRLKVVAEGVEFEEQARMLRLLRCEEMQGYLVGRPLPAAALLALLRRNAGLSETAQAA